MPTPKIEITNPQALELINKFKSGEIWVPLKSWFMKYRWYLASFLVLTVLIVAMAIGKSLSEKNPAPVFVPPDIEGIVPVEQSTVKSQFSSIKEEIQNLNTDLPDPFIPTFDNAIDLEEPII